MIVDTKNSAHMATLARYLYGEMNPEQAREFEDELKLFPENSMVMNVLKSHRDRVDQHVNKPDPDVDGAWESLLNRLRAEEQIPQISMVRPSPAIRWYGMASALALLLGVGTIILYTLVWRPSDVVLTTSPTDSGALVQTLDDGTVVYLGPNSELTYPSRFRGKYRGVSLSGQAFFDVAHHPSKPFRIQTPSSQVEVVGTRFNLKSFASGDMELVVESGSVRVSMLSNPAQSLTVTAGEQLALANAQLLRSTADNPNGLGRLRDRIHFKDATLGSIVNVLNKHHAVTFALHDPNLMGRRMTISLQGESPETIAEIICRTLSIKSEVLNDTIILSP